MKKSHISSPIKKTNSLPATQKILDHQVQHSTNLLGAENDHEAIAIFLRKAGRRSKETLRRYTRELVRFTAFLKKELNKNYADVKIADIEYYVYFIQNPPLMWQELGIDKEVPSRVFFPNPISAGKSTDQVITVLSSFFSYLCATGYITGNPTIGYDKTGDKFAKGHGEPKYFFADEWEFVIQCLQQMPENTIKQKREKERSFYIVSITYGAALRQSELAFHSCADIHPDGHGDLMLHIRGKGRRLRQLPVTKHMCSAIERFQNFHNFSMKIHGKNSFPLAPKLNPISWKALHNDSDEQNNPFRSMSPRGIRLWFSNLMKYCAQCALKINPDLAERLINKSFHSIRHTALSHLARKMDIEDLSIFSGHESITTTQQYYTPEKNRLKQLTATHGLAFDRH